MSTLKVNNIQSFTGADPVTINDQLVTSGSTATGDFAHAEGDATNASGNHSHAEGYASSASGQYSHAEGFSTTAAGEASHAEGFSCTASANYSHAEGLFTIAADTYQHTQGRYNVSSTGEGSLMIIGNGTSNANRNNLIQFRSSSFILDLNSLPTSSDLCITGQLYRSGSSFDEIRIKL